MGMCELAAAALTVLASASCTASATEVASSRNAHSAAVTAPAHDTLPINAGPTIARDGDCPLISQAAVAKADGNRVGRSEVIDRDGRAVGCRFYFDARRGYPRPVTEITSRRFADHESAYRAMLVAAPRAPSSQGVRDLVPGVDGVLYRTAFNPPDGRADWACTFVVGVTLVTVKTDQTNTSYDARQLAIAVVPAFAR
jgi:hypothetical protein